MNDGLEQQVEHQTRPWLAKPWKPGQSGNPKGLPKGTKYDLAARVRRYLKREKLDDGTGKYEPTGTLFVRTMVREAIAGDPRWGKILVSIVMPQCAGPLNQINIQNNVLSHVEGNAMIDQARLVSAIEARGDAHLIDEPQPNLPKPEPKE